LFTWTKGLETGVEVERAGAGALKAERQLLALLSVPVKLERPTTKEAFVIPPAFLKISTVKVAGLGGAMPLYDPARMEFLERVPTGAMSTLRFEVPRELLPLKVEKYTLKVDLIASDREVRVFGVKRNGSGRSAMIALKGGSVTGPSGPIELTIPATSDMQLDSEGGVIFGLDVSSVSSPTSTWILNDITLTVTARAE
jgi:hypothetical protein